MDPPMHYQHSSDAQFPQLTPSTQVFQYPSSSQSHPLDALPTDYDLINQTPQERAVLLELLRERRLVRELELKILEERRRERETVGQALGSTAGSSASPPTNVDSRLPSEWDAVSDIGPVGLSALGVTRHSPSIEPYPPHPSTLSQTHSEQHQQQQSQRHLYTSTDHVHFLNYEQQPPVSARPLNGVTATSATSSSFVFDSLPPGLGLSAAATHPHPTHHDHQQSHESLASQETYQSTGHYASQSEPRDSALTGSSVGRPSSQHGTPYENGLYGHGTTLPPMTAGWGSPSDHGPTSATTVSSPSRHRLSSSSSIYNPLHSQPTVPPMAPIVRSSSSTYAGDFNAHIYDEPQHLSQSAHAYPQSRNSTLDDGTPPPHHFYSTPSPSHHIHQQTPSPFDEQFHPSMQVKHPRLDSAPSVAVASSNLHHHAMGAVHNPTSNIHANTTQPAFSVLPTPPSVARPSSASTAVPLAAGKKPKKLLVERLVGCQHCHQQICKLLLRGTAEELGIVYDPVYECMICVPPTAHNPSRAASSSSAAAAATNGLSSVGAAGGYGSGTGGFQGSGIRITRKRTRQTEDTSNPTVCDVCIRTIGRGGLVPRIRTMPLSFAVEVICISCSLKYSRCSDCGGGSGRVGVGKWRAKELFENGRKTCKLPHVRVGGGELELSVWEVPWEVKDKKEFVSLMVAIKQLWTERVYARLAIPEVLEGGEDPWPPNSNGSGQLRNGPPPERTFKDVEEVIARGWPARERLLRSAPSPSRDTHRRYLGLSWAKSRARRERAAGKLPDPSKYAEGAQDVLMENVRRTNLLVPPASALVGMWIVDWDMRNRSILLSTSVPFESSDAEDKNIIGVGELMTRVMQDFEQYKLENPTTSIRAPQHIWIATRSITALGNARMNDTLTRRRGFVPVDEYITLHPGTERSLFTIVPDGHAWIDEAPWIRNPESGELEVLVRWLGDEIDMARLDEIKDMEYGRKSKEVQITSRARKPSGSK